MIRTLVYRGAIYIMAHALRPTALLQSQALAVGELLLLFTPAWHCSERRAGWVDPLTLPVLPEEQTSVGTDNDSGPRTTVPRTQTRSMCTLEKPS